MRADVNIDKRYLLNFVQVAGWDVDHAEIEVEGTEEEPRFIYRIPYDATAEDFECTEKMLDTFNEYMAEEADAQGWGVNGIPYMFTEVRQEAECIILIAEYYFFSV